MSISAYVTDLLNSTGLGQPSLMSATAYDTAWVAQVPAEKGPGPAYPAAWQWVCEHQLPDGSWGAARVEYVHDRVICTLAALLTLIRHGEDGHSERVQRAVRYIDTRAQFLAQEVESIAFELLALRLLDDLDHLGLAVPRQHFARYEPMRAAKLAQLPREMVYRRDLTFAFSLEFLGADLDPTLVQPEANGSIGVSPSATAYYLCHHSHDAAARRYLAAVVQAHQGQAPNMVPIDVFETTWVLWNLQLAGAGQHPAASRHLTDLQALHRQRGAVGSAVAGSFADADGTAILLAVLKRAGGEIDLRVLAPFARETHYVCFPWERNASASTNIHVLDALRGLDSTAEQIIVTYLAQEQDPRGFWVDKWHVSPVYTTGHAVVALAGLAGPAAELVRSAAGWLLRSWQGEGAWGHYGPTVEETAYAVQALVVAARQGLCSPNLARPAIQDGLAYLEAHIDDEIPPLWIGKCLYAPLRVVRAAIVSAILMAQDYLGGRANF
ncbi:MAG: hypothetical protein KKA73_00400 [Chloroflexi bacterium]|nr:hypothetical protein [Chloroflexota bacterium]